MKLYQLRRAIRNCASHSAYNVATAREWGESLDIIARHIMQSYPEIARLPMIAYPFPDHGFPVQYAMHEPIQVRAWTKDDPLVVPLPEIFTIHPESVRYGNGNGLFVRVVFGIAGGYFFMWELKGATNA